MQSDNLVIAGIEFRSRLWVGTGKYKDFAETRKAIEASGTDVVTVAVRRVNIIDKGKEKGALIPCNIFAGRLVAANGWCKVFVARP